MGVREKREMKVNVEKDCRKIDILHDTNKEDAIKAAEARGFRIVREAKKPVAIEDRTLSYVIGEEPGSSIVMYNDETGAILTAYSATESNFDRDGCSIRFVANDKDVENLMKEDRYARAEKISGDWYEYTITRPLLSDVSAFDGILNGYDKVANKIKSCKEKMDDDVLKESSVYGFLFYIDNIRIREEKLENFYNSPFLQDVMSMVFFQCAVNLMLEKFDPEVINSDCPAFDKIKDDKEFSKLFCDSIGLYKNGKTGDLSNRVILLKTAFNYLQMPEQEQNIILNAVRNRLREWDESNEDITKLIDSEAPINPENTFVGKFDKLIENSVLYGWDGETVTTDEILDCLIMTDITAVDVKLPWDVSVRENQNEVEKE